jgi:hypothetical protein
VVEPTEIIKKEPISAQYADPSSRRI